MSSVTSVAATSATPLTGISSAVLVTEVSKTSSTKAAGTQIFPAGDSGVPPSSSLAVTGVSASPGVSASSVSPKYKTVYVTKTAVPNSNAASSDLPPGAIAGIVVGCIVALALIIALVYFILRRRQKIVLEASDTPRTSGSQTTAVEESEDVLPELYGTQVYEVHGKAVFEKEASLYELDGKPFSLKSAKSRTFEAVSRNIMSRGRPVRPGKD